MPTLSADPACAEVLFVEDDEFWGARVADWGRKRGFPMRHLRYGMELLEYLRRTPHPPLCLILDLNLPDAKGFLLCDLLKKTPAYQALPIVIVTGLPCDQRECLKHGALFYLPKPFALEELTDVLTAVIAQHQRSQGVIDAGDLRLDPRSRTIRLAKNPVVQLAAGQFAVLEALVKSSPGTLSDEQLYRLFLERHSYKKADHELVVSKTLRTYVSHLRHTVGPAVAARIVRLRDEGYAYLPPR